MQNDQQAISLMPQAAYLGLSLNHRLKSVADAEHSATMAASHALLIPNATLALELLEQGRAVFWRQSLHLRTPFEALDIPKDIHEP